MSWQSQLTLSSLTTTGPKLQGNQTEGNTNTDPLSLWRSLGGVGKIKIPLLSDKGGHIARSFGCLNLSQGRREKLRRFFFEMFVLQGWPSGVSTSLTRRWKYVISGQSVTLYEAAVSKTINVNFSMNDMAVGRSVTEVLRLVHAFQLTDQCGEVGNISQDFL